MKKLLVLLSLVVATSLVATATFAVTDGNKVTSKLGAKQEVQYQQLKVNTSNFFGSVSKPFSVPNFLYGKPLFKSQNNTDNYEQIVNNFFRTYPDLFQVTISDFRVEVQKPKDRNITQVHLFQEYQNVPVFGAELIFTFNDKKELISYTGKYTPHVSIAVKPKTSKGKIQNIVTQDLSVNTITEQPRLFIFNKGILTNTQESTKLVWRLGTNGWVYFIDADTLLAG